MRTTFAVMAFYGYRYYSPDLGRWINRDPIEENGGANLYAMIQNDPVGQTDFLGQKIVTSEKTKAFRDAIEQALELLTGSELKWCERSDDWILLIDKEGAGSLWTNDLNPAITRKLPSYKLIRITETGNAWGEASGVFGRDVSINENVDVEAPVEAGVDDKGKPTYKDAKVPFAVVLWHELVGHSIKGLRHPQEDWNYWANRTWNPLPKGWGTVDPAVAIENQAREKLKLPKRRPQYYERRKVSR